MGVTESLVGVLLRQGHKFYMFTGIGATCMLALVFRRLVICASPYLGSIYRYTMYALFTLLFHGHTQFYWIGLLFCCHAAWLWRFRDVASRAVVGGLSALYICTAGACCGTGRFCGGHRQMLQEYTHATGTLSATVLLQWA